ncbi:MAG: archaeosortase A [Euryarchaeota archaeon]|jgi:archaeosortase A (PGF-CTERM-specific)|nr:archaeosortase A [Euryarchaeota archaeon]MBT7245075.1 archaeosortase A [Euryarchaeota archaeon]
MAGDLLVDRSVATILGAIGMFILFVTWRMRSERLEIIAPIGWLLTGFYFFNETGFYYYHEDAVLTIMSAATLPGAIAIAVWERRVVIKKYASALRWFRGAVAAAGLPYLLIAHVPMLNVLAIWFVAWQSAALLSFAGGADVTLGDTYANPVNGQSVEWSSWEGNRWFLTEEMSEYSFHTELLVNGEPLYINFVLACTAIQSMIIFVGAISVLDISWRKRIRALFIALSLIHILNLFRNAGLIWLQMGYPDWRWMNLTIFEFGHAYASRVVSLGAMFLLALVLFEMLPQMHRHVLSLLRPLGLEPGKKRNQS